MTKRTLSIKLSEYEYRMVEDMKSKLTKLTDGELALAGDIFLAGINL